MDPESVIVQNMINVLKKIDKESKQKKDDVQEFNKCGLAIKKILDKIEIDFGTQFMIKIFYITCQELGHTLGPLDSSILQKLIKNGFVIKNINKKSKYCKS